MEEEDTNSSFNWQRQFFVTDHVKHKNGFTLYKITSIVFPKLNPEAGTKIIVWKRYNEFKSLHRELKRRHGKSRIGEEFPPLIKFSLDVINKRKKFISLFLNFVAKSPALFTADIFVKFFEVADSDELICILRSHNLKKALAFSGLRDFIQMASVRKGLKTKVRLKDDTQNGYNISEYDSRNTVLNNVAFDFKDPCINSSLIFLRSSSMGQVLNAEESKSSDESSDDIRFVTKSSLPWSNLSMNDSKGENKNIPGECGRSHWKMAVKDKVPIPLNAKTDFRGLSDYWEEAIAHAEEAYEQEMLGQYEVSFAMYKTAIVCLLSGVQSDVDMKRRAQVKELTSKYLQQAERIYNNYLMFQPKSSPSKLNRIPRRSRTQLQRYKVLSILDSNLLVQDVVDNAFVVIKGVLKSSCPVDKNEVCILPNNVSHLVKLIAFHETETTVFFVLEHIRYGKLWNHLEHYFTHDSLQENLDTEVTCPSSRSKCELGGNGGGWDENSVTSSGSSSSTNDTKDGSLSRLESSAYTDAMSCESLSSHEENYFDLIEDYARAKSKKLMAIRDFNERRKRVVESIRPVKKTVSQVDLKSVEETSYDQHRSHSLTDLAVSASSPPPSAPLCGDFNDEGVPGNRRLVHRCDRWHSGCLVVGSGDEDEDADVDDSIARYRRHSLHDCETSSRGDLLSSVDMDTQQLLRNAQRLIESINETLSKNEATNNELATNPFPESRTSVSSVSREERLSIRLESSAEDYANFDHEWQRAPSPATVTGTPCQARVTNTPDKLNPYQHCGATVEAYNSTVMLTPGSESIPSITEEYSITAVIQRNGVSEEVVKKWAAQIVIALEGLHASGVVCRDLNPNNVLLADNGAVKLTYFFRYPNVDPTLNTEAKQKLYVAPEVDGTSSNISFASDWWSFGAILYELTTLQALYRNHPAGINSHTVVYVPDSVCVETKSLLIGLLRYDPNERLGSGICGVDDVKAHPYFSNLNWEDV